MVLFQLTRVMERRRFGPGRYDTSRAADGEPATPLALAVEVGRWSAHLAEALQYRPRESMDER